MCSLVRVLRAIHYTSRNAARGAVARITGVLADLRSVVLDYGELDVLLAIFLHVRWKEHVWDDALLSLFGRDDNAGES